MRNQNLFNYRNPKNHRGKSILIVQLWYIIKNTLFKLSPRFANKWRASLLRAFGADIGRSVIIRPSVDIEYPWRVKIGDHSWIGESSSLYSLGQISIGNNTVISQKTYLCSGTHDYLSDNFDIMTKDINIGNECWIATDVFIGPGVTIPNKCVVGARSSVYKSITASGVYCGNPAVLFKSI